MARFAGVGTAAATIAAIETILTDLGQDVCATEYGKHLGKGLFEFRVRHDEGVFRAKAGEGGGGKGGEEVLLRIFCHAHGEKIVLLLGGLRQAQRPERAEAESRNRESQKTPAFVQARGESQEDRKAPPGLKRFDSVPIWDITHTYPRIGETPMGSKFDDFVGEVEAQATPEGRQELEAARARFRIGSRILQQRLAAGLTQQQLADASGIAQADISRIERGQANPTAETLEILARPLGVVLDLVSAGAAEVSPDS